MATPNPADLPSYEHATLTYLKPALTLLLDCYEGLYQHQDTYLPKAQMEPQKAYEARLGRSVFNNKVRPIIDSNAGLLTAFEVSGLPASLAAAEDNVDNQGSSFKSWVYAANVLGLRDGVGYVLTLQEADEVAERTRLDDLENPRRPYWKLIDRRNVLNWRIEYIGGQPVLRQVTILMHEDRADGLFGFTSEPRYHVLTLVDAGVQHAVYAIGTQGELIEAEAPKIEAGLPRIPLRAYPSSAAMFPSEIPEFYKAAELNIKLFREESTLSNIQHQVNAPTSWRRSSQELKDRPPFIKGESYVIELFSADGVNGPDEVGTLELEGTGIDRLQKSVEETKSDIEAESLGFLLGGRIQRTATETYISSAQVASSLNGKARQISAALTGMVEDWCLFTGEDPSQFQIEMDHSLLEMPLDAQEMQGLLALWQAGAIDHRTLLELLRMGRQLPPSANIDQILERVEAEVRRQTAAPVIPNGLVNPLERLEEEAGNGWP